MKSLMPILTYFLIFLSLKSAGQTIPVDTNQVPCISLSAKTSRIGEAIRYDYMFSNGCNANFDIELTTHAGWSVLHMVNAGSQQNWFCTDGHKANRDCGGLASYVVRSKGRTSFNKSPKSSKSVPAGYITLQPSTKSQGSDEPASNTQKNETCLDCKGMPINSSNQSSNKQSSFDGKWVGSGRNAFGFEQNHELIVNVNGSSASLSTTSSGFGWSNSSETQDGNISGQKLSFSWKRDMGPGRNECSLILTSQTTAKYICTGQGGMSADMTKE